MKVFRSIAQRELFSRDQGELPPVFRKIFETLPASVVQPNSIQEVADTIRTAYQSGIPIVPRGAGSTAFGQVTPVFGGMVLDLSFLKRIHAVDSTGLTVTVESGVRWADLSAFLEGRGLALGSYPSSWYSTIGGWIATGGIGINTLGFGPLSEQVREIQLCLRNGELRTYPCGSREFEACFETEGQMGVIVSAKIRVRPLAGTFHSILVPCSDAQTAWKLFSEIVSSRSSVLHASLYNPVRMGHFNHTLEAKMAHQHSEITGPFERKWSVLVYLEDKSAADGLKTWLKARQALPAADFQAAYIWQERFYPLKGKRYDQMFLGNEVRIENARGASYTNALEDFLGRSGIETAVEINAATAKDSVVISSFTGDYNDPEQYFSRLALLFRVDKMACGDFGARIYHVGLYNSPFVRRKFSADRLSSLRQVKKEFDPKKLYNPGKFFEFKTSWTRSLAGSLHALGFKAFLPLLSRPSTAKTLFGMANRFLGVGTVTPSSTIETDRVLKTGRECVNCGFCIPVCPAYLATRDERTAARGKLFMATRWAEAEELTREDATLLQSCMHCGACTKVCQNTLDLVPVWRELEARIVSKFGKPVEAIEQFVHDVESSEDYKRLLRRGFITET